MKTLKLNSISPTVKSLQIFLGLTPDGIFGTKTHKAVINFQIRHNLNPDGIVGSKTFQVLFNLGFLAEQLEELDRFEIKNYFLHKNKYFKGPTKKRWIFLHHTHGWHDPYKVVDDWNKKNTKVGTHFVIGGIDIHNEDHRFDGLILQTMPEEAFAWHLGIGNQIIHRESIGIELCSFGYLNKGFISKKINNKETIIQKDANKFYTTTGIEVHDSQVFTCHKSFRGQRHFHKYSEKQLNSLQNLIEYLGYTHNIDIQKGLFELFKQHGQEAFNLLDVKRCRETPGFWSHSNVAANKFDVSPQENLLEMLKSL